MGDRLRGRLCARRTRGDWQPLRPTTTGGSPSGIEEAAVTVRTHLRTWALRNRLRRIDGRVQVGSGLQLQGRLDIVGPGHCIIGEGAVIGCAPGRSDIFVTIYTHSPDAVVRIGCRARLFGARISCRYSIEIGDDLHIEDAGIVDTDFHAPTPDRGPPRHERSELCSIVIGDRVAIAARALITKGVRIGHDCTVGPGAIVSRSLPDGCFALGNPARVWNGTAEVGGQPTVAP